MDTSAILKVLEIYYEAFAEKDANRRCELLAGCLTPDAEIWGHSQVFTGYTAISEKIAGFQSNFPGCHLALGRGLFTFEKIVRLANAIVRLDGFVVANGETVMEVAPDGRFCRVVPLWEMSLPPLPEAWPEHLAAPPAPKVSNAT
ncbi:MAG TPA: nuclear transport factor 2 family protein [Terrimicrobiaceae bacterium]|nr:nuclear transport factor 2 family protein [Terrimicrobiaceae bacterium]